MEYRTLTQQHIEAFLRYLVEEEKSAVTVEKYLRDVRAFFVFAGEQPMTKEITVAYKKHLIQCGYAAGSVNSMLASLNSLFRFLHWEECRVKHLRTQKKLYCPEEKELLREEYLRLLHAARAQPRLQLIVQTICSTGIRVSELQYFTVEAVRRGEIAVSCKNKTRTILIPGKLRKQLLRFGRTQGIESGVLFRTKSGKPIHRSSIWAAMKRLCAAANVAASKVFPHNLRKLFARTFYTAEKDIAQLADLLGHSSINTTRIYIMTTGTEHRRKMEGLRLLL